MDSKEATETVIDDMRSKLKLMEQENINNNTLLRSLQNKFQVDSKLIDSKKRELSKEKSLNQKLKEENEKLSKESEINHNMINKLSDENSKLKRKVAKITNDLEDMTGKYNESKLQSNYEIGRLEEHYNNLTKENTTLKETSNKFRTQIELLDKESKEKESKLISTMKKEKNILEEKLRNEIIKLEKDKENLKIETQNLKKQNQTLSNELAIALKENQNSPINNANLTRIIQMEQEVKELKEEKKKSKNQIKQMENIAILNDKTLKEIMLELQQSEKNTKDYLTAIEEKDQQISKLEEENLILKNSLDKGNAGNLILELQEKNETINFLLNKIDYIEKQLSNEQRAFKDKINEITKSRNELKIKFNQSQTEFKKSSDGYQNKIDEMYNEHKNLLNELNGKDREYTELVKDKLSLKLQYDNKFKEEESKRDFIKEMYNILNKENEELKNQITQNAQVLNAKMEEINSKSEKSQKKIEKFIDLYDKHITLLKTRFQTILDKLIIIHKLTGKPKELNEKYSNLIKAIQKTIDEQTNQSQKDALIENFKIELKSLKNKQTINEKKIKQLQSENTELNKILNMRKSQIRLQQKEQNETPQDKILSNLNKLINESATITEFNVKITYLESKLKEQKIKNNILQDQLQSSQDEIEKCQSTIAQLKSQISNKSKETNELAKNHKNEIKSLLNEVKNIKSTLISNDKKTERENSIDDLEKTVKKLKKDIVRKNEIITELKDYIEVQENKNAYSETKEESTQNLQRSIGKKLKNSIGLKDSVLNSKNKIIALYKGNERRLQKENETSSEKNKSQKGEIQSKDGVILIIKNNPNYLTDDMEKYQIEKKNIMMNKRNKEFGVSRLQKENVRKNNYFQPRKGKNEAMSLERNKLSILPSKPSKSYTIENRREGKNISINNIKKEIII